MELTKRQMDIITAAIDVIATMGYEKLTTKNLAAQIKVTEAALYRHFESKNELMGMILGYFEKISCRVIEDIKADNLPPVERIKRFVLDRYELFGQNPNLARVMFSEELFKNVPAFTDHYQMIMHTHRNEVIGYIKAAQEDGSIYQKLDPGDLFRMIVGSMRFTVLQWNLSGQRFDLRAEGAQLLETIIKLKEVKK